MKLSQSVTRIRANGSQFEEMAPSLRLAKYSQPGRSNRTTSRSFLRSCAPCVSSSAYNLLGLQSLFCTSRDLHSPLGARCNARNLPARFAARPATPSNLSTNARPHVHLADCGRDCVRHCFECDHGGAQNPHDCSVGGSVTGLRVGRPAWYPLLSFRKRPSEFLDRRVVRVCRRSESINSLGEFSDPQSMNIKLVIDTAAVFFKHPYKLLLDLSKPKSDRVGDDA